MKINPSDFSKGLLDEFKKKVSDNHISTKELTELITIAEKDGLNHSETAFLTSLTEKNGVELLKNQMGKALKTINISDYRLDYAKDPNYAARAGNIELDREIEKREGISFAKIDAQFLQSFKKLDARSQNILSEMLNDSETFGRINGNHLKALLVKGTLAKTDKDGKSILDNLHELYKGPSMVGDTPKTYKPDFKVAKELAGEAVSALLSTASITQGPHYTCGSASLENYLQMNDPGELLRIVKDLSQKGITTLRDGSTMNAPKYSLNFKTGDSFIRKNDDGHNTEDRSRFDIIFQSAVMDEIALVGGDRNKVSQNVLVDPSYNVKNDVDGQNLKGDGGAHWLAIKKLTKAITQKEATSHGVAEWTFIANRSTKDDSPKLTEKLVNFFEKNPGKQAIILYHKDGKNAQSGAHYVLATGLIRDKDGKATGISFMNTMANTGKDGFVEAEADPAKKTKSFCSMQSKSIDEFKRTMCAMVLMP